MNPGTPISFNGNSLQTSNIAVADIQGHTNLPDKDVRLYKFAHAHASDIPFEDYVGRTIKASGTLSASSASGLESLIDTFKGYCIGNKKNLDIGWAGGTRRFIATVESAPIPRPGGLFFANFDIKFLCTDPFGRDTAVTTAALTGATGRTASQYNDTYSFGGTAPYQYPVTTITYTALSASGSQYAVWGNGNTGQVIVVNRVWANGDVLVIDTENHNVTVNGINVYFTGAWPEFPSSSQGAQTLMYYDTFNSRTFNIGMTYLARYL